jgi:hypothetical protein
MEDVVIVSGIRSPIGKFQGAFANTPASDLGASVVKEAVSRAGLSPQQVDHVVFGCVGQVMEDRYRSRNAAVKAGMPIETPAVTVNRICGSGLEAINTAPRYIQTAEASVVAAGAAENMTMMPYYVRNGRTGYRMGNGVLEDGILHLLGDPFSKQHMGIAAENLAEKYEISREVQRVAPTPLRERKAATGVGKFKEEIVPMAVKADFREPRYARLRSQRNATQILARPARARPQVFVLMPFKPENDDLYELGIRAVTRRLGLGCERADEILHVGSVTDEIWDAIENADVVVAVVSEPNLNVYLEIGWALRSGKPVVLLTTNLNAIPFNLRGHRHMVYQSIFELRPRLAELLKELVLRAG